MTFNTLVPFIVFTTLVLFPLMVGSLSVLRTETVAPVSIRYFSPVK